MASWRGTGLVKHLATASLWLQDAVFQRELKLVIKAGTRDNVADSGPKPLSGPELALLTKLIGYELRHEPAEGALLTASKDEKEPASRKLLRPTSRKHFVKTLGRCLTVEGDASSTSIRSIRLVNSSRTRPEKRLRLDGYA